MPGFIGLWVRVVIQGAAVDRKSKREGGMALIFLP